MPLALPPLVLTLTRVVMPLTRLRIKMSFAMFVSLAAISLAVTFKKYKLAVRRNSRRKKIAIAAAGTGRFTLTKMVVLELLAQRTHYATATRKIIVRQHQVVCGAGEQDIATILADDGKPRIPVAAQLWAKGRTGGGDSVARR